MRRTLVTGAALSVLCLCGLSPVAGQTTEAFRPTIDAFLNYDGVILVAGSVEFGPAGANLPGRRVLDSELPLYRKAAELGLVRISNERFFKGPVVTETAEVTFTDKLRNSGTPMKFGDVDGVFLGIVKARVGAIIADDQATLAGERYRYVAGTFSASTPAEWSDSFAAARGPGHLGELRFRAMWKLDAIAGKWTVSAYDLGLRESDFGTSEVPLAMRLLGWPAK